MFCDKIKKYCGIYPILMATLVFVRCSNLVPDDRDLRARNPLSILKVGDTARDFTLPITDGTSLDLAASLAGKNAVVFYFTMWCPVCTSHTDEIVQTLIPAYPAARFVIVDYVSSNLTESAMLKTYGGYDATGIVVALDSTQSFMKDYAATMASTVIVDSTHKIRMSETYKKIRIVDILGAL